jgi:Domain of unknown function (DUF4278)
LRSLAKAGYFHWWKSIQLSAQDFLMQRIHRGHVYDYDPTKTRNQPFQQVRTTGPAYRLMYRGESYLIDPQVTTSPEFDAPRDYQLIYRGETYAVHKTAEGKRYINHGPKAIPLPPLRKGEPDSKSPFLKGDLGGSPTVTTKN